MELLLRERRNLDTLLVKLNGVIGSSFTGYLISRLRLRGSRYCAAKSCCGGLKEVLYLHKNEEDLAEVINKISIFVPDKEKEEVSLETEISQLNIVHDYGFQLSNPEISNLHAKLHWKIEDANEKISNLNRTIELLHDKFKRSTDLGNEITSLKITNSELLRKNLELTLQLKMAQTLISTEEIVTEEANFLRLENENLKSDIEKLKIGRCTDAEQSVYLKWVNACLRYELRNCKSPSGLITAKDLSKSASPDSQEKAKLLILQYASHDAEFCAERPSSFRISIEEHGEAHAKRSRTSPKKPKFLTKFSQIMTRRKASLACFPIEEDQTKQNDVKIFDCDEEMEEIHGEKEHVGERENNNAELLRFAEALKRTRTTSKFNYVRS